MRRGVSVVLLGLSVAFSAHALDIKGKIKDRKSGEEIIGATVCLKEDPTKGVVSGLDGSFSLSLKEGQTLVCSYIGYKPVEYVVRKKEGEVLITMESMDVALDEVVVIGRNPGRSEAGARGIERQAMNVVNVMSAKAIELSPDITVANVIQRMSGVTIERNSSGEGQYAILRGMDKRYNYTLINGVKIPSPDNKNRFVPLDIFPSEMLDRLEVTKSLTANMEGDGISGAIVKQSPYEAKGFPEDNRVTMDDFTTDNLRMKWKKPLPDLIGGLSYGDRFFSDKLGVMVAASYLNTYRGKESQLYYQPGKSHYGIEYRDYSAQQTRVGAHVKFDYQISDRHKLTWYNGYMDMREAEVRDGEDEKERAVRMKWNHQYIINSTLKGEHAFLEEGALRLNWSAVLSKAFSETPDNVEIFMLGNHVQSSDAATRRWEHNSDRDKAGYVDLSYKWKLDNGIATRTATVSLMNILSTPPRDRAIRSTWARTGTISTRSF